MRTRTFFHADEVINELTILARNKKLVYRGYGKQSELYPNIIRENNLINREIELLNAFEKYGLQYFSVNNAIDFMSYAQHYGLPTRLLDFTYNPFIALFFSLFMPKGSNYTDLNDKDFYYIRYCDISKQLIFNSLPVLLGSVDVMMKADSFSFQCKKGIETINKVLNLLDEQYDEDKHEVEKILMYFSTIYRTTHNHKFITDVELFRSYLVEILNKFRDGRILFIDANQCSSRIIMQQGLFMFPYNLERKKHKSTLIKNTNLIKIHKETRSELLAFLETMGLDSFRLMPDLQNVCFAIKRQIIENRNTTY